MFILRVFFESLSRKFKLLVNMRTHKYIRTFMKESRWIILKIKNIPHRICRGNQNTHFNLNNSFPKIVPSVEKICAARHVNTIWRMRFARWITKATNTHRICNTYCYSMPQCYVTCMLHVACFVTKSKPLREDMKVVDSVLLVHVLCNDSIKLTKPL